MGYLHGKFVWFTLFSNDVTRAKGFYGELFGWKAEEMKMPDGVYHVFKNGEVGIGGTMSNPQKGTPSHWLSYVSVDDVDAKAKSVASGGGKVLMGPMDVPTVGREATVADPKGAVVALFKSAQGDGDEKKPADGDFCWNELWTSDAAASLAFYEKQIGYTHEEMPMPQGAYNILKSNGVPRAGLMKSPDPKIPPMWLGYVQVKDVDATAKRAKALGGELVADLQDVPGVGRFGIVKDPTGAVIGIITQPAK